MEHEIIIKNGIAGVEINGRFYTHIYLDDYVRLIDADGNGGQLYIAEHIGTHELIYHCDCSQLTPIPNPALSWPAGTKVMVRNDSRDAWKCRLLKYMGRLVSCTDMNGETSWWSECKLAEGGE